MRASMIFVRPTPGSIPPAPASIRRSPISSRRHRMPIRMATATSPQATPRRSFRWSEKNSTCLSSSRWRCPRLNGLSVAVDYWEIAQKDVISAGGGIAVDSAALQAATQAALAAGQNINSIDLGSGTANYQGDPSVVRLPVTQNDKDLFAAYN